MRGFLGILFIFAALHLQSFHPENKPDFAALPDHDYISEIRQLLSERRYGEAKTLCEDVRNAALPCAAEAAELSLAAERESKKTWNRICKAGRAFITGEPDDSIEEVGGSIISDMVIYGDIRDLVKQGWFKISGKETDPLISSLAAIGLATELVDAADWIPAALKAMRKAGAITAKMADSLQMMCKKIIKKRKLDKSAKIFFADAGKMLDSSGFIRSKNMFSYVNNADELAFLAKHSKENPALTHLVVKRTGRESIEALKKYPPEYLRAIARKGRIAIRTIKIFHKNRNLLDRIPEKYIRLAAAGFSLAGILLLVSAILPFIMFFRRDHGEVNSSSSVK